jgi:hypothetical protein
MRLSRIFTAFVALLAAASAIAGEPTSDQIRSRFERIKAAVESGDEIRQPDLEAVIAFLRTAQEEDHLRDVVGRIDSVFRSDGNAPAAAKKYIVEQSSPLLVALAADRTNSSFLRGDAIHALRDIGAPRSVLAEVAAMALKDSDGFVQSRGEILQNYVASMPEESELDALRPADAAKEREAAAFLESRKLGVSLDQLRLSAIESDAEAVTALLAAGVDPNAGAAGDSPLVRALSACGHQGGENEQIVETVEALLAGGADVKRKDDNANTPLMTAAQYCGAKAVGKLIAAGAEVNVTNGSGISPLAMALIMSRLDAAEALAAKGATLTADQVTMVSGMATDPRAKAVIAKAKKKKK